MAAVFIAAFILIPSLTHASSRTEGVGRREREAGRTERAALRY